MKRRSLAIAALVSGLALAPGLLAAQTSTPAAEAQKAFDRGLLAVQQQQWGLAARHFSDAQKLGGNDPRLYFNLALANSKAGRDLPAIAWFDAYLALVPGAANARMVAGEIAHLKQSAREKIRRIVSAARDAAQVSGQQDYVETQYAKKVLEILKGPAADIPTLIDLNEFDRAAAAVDNVHEEKDRDDALSSVVTSLLGGRPGHYDEREVELAQVERFLQKIGDPAKRASLAAKLNEAKLQVRFDESLRSKNFDDHLLEEFLPLKTDPWARNSVILQAARAKVGEKKYAAIDPLLARLEANPQHDEQLAQFLATLSLIYLQRGDVASAHAVAQRLAAIPAAPDAQVARYVAVGKAMLGDPAQVVPIAKKDLQGPFGSLYPIFQGDPDLVGFYQDGFDSPGIADFMVGAATFSLAMHGQSEQALKLAQSFKDVATNPIAYTNIAYAFVLQGNTARALQILRGLPPDTKHTNGLSKRNLQAQSACFVALEALKKADFKTAEEALALIPADRSWSRTTGTRYGVELLLHFAETAHAKNNPAQYQKYIGAAMNQIAAARANVEIQLKNPDQLDDLVERVAKTQERIGDAAGAARTRTRLTPPVPPAVKAWLELIAKESLQRYWSDGTGERLSEIAKGDPAGAGGMLGGLAQSMAIALHRMEALEEKLNGGLPKSANN